MILVLLTACAERPLPDHPDPWALALLAPDWVGENDTDGAAYGGAVATADVNGDGFGDVIVGASQDDPFNGGFGAAFAYLGSAAGPSATTADWEVSSDQEFSYFGAAVAWAGDVNGDGFDDVLVSMGGYDGPQAGEENLGRVFLYEGSATGLETVASWAIEGEQSTAGFGAAVAGAGDVNGDGFDDVLVSAPYFDGAEIDEGAVWLYLGSATGLETFADWSSGIGVAGALFGWSLAGAGDVNADGFADVAIGAFHYDDGASEEEGRAEVFLGSATGLPTGGPSWIGQNDEANSQFGAAVGFADVDADGFDDVLVGAAKAAGSVASLFNQGQVYGYRGSVTGPSAVPDWTVESDDSEPNFGATLTGLGDANGDGFDDLAVGAPYYDLLRGQVFIYFGSAAGFTTEDGRLDTGTFEGNLGAAVAAGDVNGDGLTDLVAGAPGNVNGGQAFLVLGACVGLDSDGDTVLDSCDRCPGFDDRQDTDGDVVPDDCDVCPLVADPGQEDSNGNGVGDACADADSDGFLEGTDCDDTDATVYPGATEVCDGKDTACTGTLPADEADADGDGFFACNGECDDTNPLRHPGATEDCDGLDDDCDGAFAYEVDQDGDGFMGCEGDCDDANPARHAGALEVCNDFDDNCNGDVDEACPTAGESGGCGCNSAAGTGSSWWLVALSLLIARRPQCRSIG